MKPLVIEPSLYAKSAPYVSALECADYMVKRMPLMTFTPKDPVFIQRAINALYSNQPIEVDIPRWTGLAYVTEVMHGWDRSADVSISIRPTGAPYMRASDPVSGISMRIPTKYYPPSSNYLQTVMQEGLAMFKKQLKSSSLINRVYEDAYVKEKKPMKVRNAYYVASPNVTLSREQDTVNTDPVPGGDAHARPGARWAQKDLKVAITHAESILNANPNQEHVAIVKIIRVVRRKKAPLVVEVVR